MPCTHHSVSQIAFPSFVACLPSCVVAAMGEEQEGDWSPAEPVSAPAASASEPVSAPAASGLAPDETATPWHRQTRRAGGQCAAQNMEELRAQKGRAEWSSDYTPPGFKHLKTDDQGHFALGIVNLGDMKTARDLRNQNICLSPCTILCIQEATLSTQKAVVNAASNAAPFI